MKKKGDFSFTQLIILLICVLLLLFIIFFSGDIMNMLVSNFDRLFSFMRMR